MSEVTGVPAQPQIDPIAHASSQHGRVAFFTFVAFQIEASIHSVVFGSTIWMFGFGGAFML
jgi:hypothetical protein